MDHGSDSLTCPSSSVLIVPLPSSSNIWNVSVSSLISSCVKLSTGLDLRFPISVSLGVHRFTSSRALVYNNLIYRPPISVWSSADTADMCRLSGRSANNVIPEHSPSRCYNLPHSMCFVMVSHGQWYFTALCPCCLAACNSACSVIIISQCFGSLTDYIYIAYQALEYFEAIEISFTVCVLLESTRL